MLRRALTPRSWPPRGERRAARHALLSLRRRRASPARAGLAARRSRGGAGRGLLSVQVQPRALGRRGAGARRARRGGDHARRSENGDPPPTLRRADRHPRPGENTGAPGRGPRGRRPLRGRRARGRRGAFFTGGRPRKDAPLPASLRARLRRAGAAPLRLAGARAARPLPRDHPASGAGPRGARVPPGDRDPLARPVPARARRDRIPRNPDRTARPRRRFRRPIRVPSRRARPPAARRDGPRSDPSAARPKCQTALRPRRASLRRARTRDRFGKLPPRRARRARASRARAA